MFINSMSGRTAAVTMFGLVAIGAGVSQAAGTADSQLPPKVAAYQGFSHNRSQAPVAGDTARLAAPFAAFNRSSKATDSPSARSISLPVESRAYKPSQFRKLGSVKGAPVYAVPVAGGVCLTSSADLVSGCFPSAALPNDRRNATGALDSLQAVICGPDVPAGSTALYGLVPSGIESVSLTREDGSVDEITVEDNFLYHESSKASSPVTNISWLAADGTRVVDPSPFPRDASEACA